MTLLSRPPFFSVGDSCDNTYKIENSIRLDGSTTFLTRTPASDGNRRVFTVSFWMKKTVSGISKTLFSANDGSGNASTLAINNGTSRDNLLIQNNSGNIRESKSSLSDASAWYHILLKYDTTASTETERVRLYINGEIVNDYESETSVPLNATSLINSANLHTIGKDASLGFNLDGYMAEFHFIDGQALTPDEFGFVSNSTGEWVPKAYTGTYGTNGFYLNFSNSANLGEDSSGNGNDFTPNNITSNNQVTDTPTNNYSIFNFLENRVSSGGVSTISNGGRTSATSVVGNATAASTFKLPSSGKFYVEFHINSSTYNTSQYLGLINLTTGITIAAIAAFPGSNNFLSNGVLRSYGSPFVTGNTVGVAVNLDLNAIWFSINDTWQAGATLSEIESGDTTNAAPISVGVNLAEAYLLHNDSSPSGASSVTLNTGQMPFTGTQPNGFLTLNTENFISEDGEPDIVKPENWFKSVTYTGNGVARDITGLNFQPDLVWIKNRDQADSHKLIDSVRGVMLSLSTDSTSGESTESNGLTSFRSDGFSLGTGENGYNDSGENFVAWCWRRNIQAGFDIVTYGGTGSIQNVPHGLGTTPEFIIIKRTDSSGNWVVYHKSAHANPETGHLYLNTQNIFMTNSTVFNNTSPTSSEFTVGTSVDTNDNGGTYVAYLWAGVPGFSEFGKYRGNGSLNGSFVHNNFSPAYTLCKPLAGSYSWSIKDNVRDEYNVKGSDLAPNQDNAENTNHTLQDFVSNGFKLRTTGSTNLGGVDNVYCSFSESPFNNKCNTPTNAR